MRKIKFRGVTLDDGTLITGTAINVFSEVHVEIQWDRNGIWYKVNPDSVAQLVGYDADGREVYEGDLLTDDRGFEYEAMIQSMVYIPTEARTIPLDFVKRFTPLKLKEAYDDGATKGTRP